MNSIVRPPQTNTVSFFSLAAHTFGHKPDNLISSCFSVTSCLNDFSIYGHEKNIT